MKDSFFVTDERHVKHEIFKEEIADFNGYATTYGLCFSDAVFKRYGACAYELPDGKVLLEETGEYSLYPSLNLVLEVLKKDSNPYKHDILVNKNPYGQHFPDRVDELIHQLYNEFGVFTRNFDRPALLQKLDGIILKNRQEDFLDKYFLSFIAFTGKSIIEEFNGRWKMILSDDQLTWLPFIEVNGQAIFFANYIREDFFNSTQQQPLTEVYETIHNIICANIMK